MNTSENAQKVIECRVCGELEWQDVVSFGSVPLANSYLDPAYSYADEPRYPLGVVSCRSCRLMSLTHIVDPEILYRTYFYVTSESETIKRHMSYVSEVCRERFEIPKGGFVVEIGSNTGAQLVAFRDVGMRTLGVDPARSLATVANERGIETLPEFFSAGTAAHIAKEFGKARLVLARHVFAHIDDVAGIAVGVRQLLEPAGVFVIEVPYVLDMLEKNEFDTIYHEHLSYFAVGTLVTLFERHGLRVIDVERLTVHGGSILVFVGLNDGLWPVRPIVDELLALEERAGLYEDATYHRFARHVEQTCDSLISMVRGLVADGKRIAGYGAPAKGNTLLNVCGLGPDDVEFCSDTTELKHGKVLPGTHIPIHTPEYGKAHSPDYYLLLAWNYAEEIIRKEHGFLEGGGRFIVPIPQPSIVSAETPAGEHRSAAFLG